ALLVAILHTLPGMENGVLPARDDGQHELLARAKGGRHLSGFEQSEAAARAGAHENDSPTFAERPRDDVYADGNAIAFAMHGREHLAILIEHAFNDVGGRQLVDGERRGVDGFGRQRLPLRVHRHSVSLTYQTGYDITVVRAQSTIPSER